MAQKVSNKKRTIATKGTKHKPTATAPDMCKLPNNVPAPFPNWILTDKLQNGTVYTKIGKDPIWMKAAQIGPSSEPPHAGVNKGVNTGAYRGEAVATSWSPDVLTEGEEVVRTNDTTTQNHRNTVGIVDGRALGEALDDPNAYAKLLCTLSELEGEAEAEGDEGKKPVVRKLGFEGAEEGEEGDYLEILEGDHVKFTSTRLNITLSEPEKHKDPLCGRVGDKHTEWNWTRSGGSMEALKKGPFKGKKYELAETTGKTVGATVNDLGKKVGVDVGAPDMVKAGGGDMTFLGGGAASRDGAETKAPEIKPHARTTAGSVTTVGGVGGSALAFVALWNAYNDPLSFEVIATACSGSKKAKIKAFPARPVKLSLQFGAAGKEKGGDCPVTTRMSKGMLSVKSVFDAVAKISEFAGQKFEFELFVGVSAGCEGRYVACKEKKIGKWGKQYTPAHVGRKWKIWFGADPLIKVKVAWSFLLLNLVAPCLGSIAAAALRRCGASFDLVFGLECSLAVTFNIGQDEYDFFNTETNQATVIKIIPSLALALEVGIKLVTLQAAWIHTGTIKFQNGEKKGQLIQMALSITASLELTMVVLDDTWVAQHYKATPSWGKLNYLDKKYDVLTLS